MKFPEEWSLCQAGRQERCKSPSTELRYRAEKREKEREKREEERRREKKREEER